MLKAVVWVGFQQRLCVCLSVCFSTRYFKNRRSYDRRAWYSNVPPRVLETHLFLGQKVKGSVVRLESIFLNSDSKSLNSDLDSNSKSVMRLCTVVYSTNTSPMWVSSHNRSMFYMCERWNKTQIIKHFCRRSGWLKLCVSFISVSFLEL